MTIDSTLFAGTEFTVIFWGIVLNVVLGVLVSLLRGTFNFHHLTGFLMGMVLPYVLLYAVMRVFDGSFTYGTIVTQVVFVFIVLSLLAGVWEKLGHFGLSTPKWLSRAER